MRYCPTKEACRDLLCSRAFVTSGIAATLSGSLSAVLFYTDRNLGSPFLETILPADVVFNVFVTFVSLVAAFRTSHALTRYTDAAMYIHKLQACWFDSASTLFAFCRASSCDPGEINQFQQTLVRLISLSSALALDSLQVMAQQNDYAYRYEVLGAEDLDLLSQDAILNAEGKVEFVFQMLQQLVVDGMTSGVLSIAPPILTRSFQEMGAALMCYHEAQKLSRVPLPFAYVLVTLLILVSEAFFVPFMMAFYVKGILSAFVYTFAATFLIWFVNCVDDALDNPFQKEAGTLDSSRLQRELNLHLNQLLDQAEAPVPRTCYPRAKAQRSSFGEWARNTTSRSKSRDASEDDGFSILQDSTRMAELGQASMNNAELGLPADLRTSLADGPAGGGAHARRGLRPECVCHHTCARGSRDSRHESPRDFAGAKDSEAASAQAARARGRGRARALVLTQRGGAASGVTAESGAGAGAGSVEFAANPPAGALTSESEGAESDSSEFRAQGGHDDGDLGSVWRF